MPEKPKCLNCNRPHFKMCKGLCVHCYEQIRYKSLKTRKHLYYLQNKEKWSRRNKQKHYAKRNTEYAEVKKYTDAQLMALKPVNTTPDPFSIVPEIESLGLEYFI